jgi:hypothetical protein
MFGRHFPQHHRAGTRTISHSRLIDILLAAGADARADEDLGADARADDLSVDDAKGAYGDARCCPDRR